MKSIVAVVSFGLLLGLAGTAFADKKEEARDHYKKGTTLYDLGKYDEAVVEYQAAYELADAPVLLYNMAQAYRLANKYQEAVRFYRTYLRKSPKAPNKDEVDNKIADLEQLIASQPKTQPAGGGDGKSGTAAGGEKKEGTTGTTTATTETKPAETKPVETKPAETKPAVVKEAKPEPVYNPEGERKTKKILIAAGVALVVVGLAGVVTGVVGGLGASSASSAQGTSPVYQSDLESKGHNDDLMQIVGYSAGGALVVVGAVVAVIGAIKKVHEPAAPAKEAPKDKPKTALIDFTISPAVSSQYAGGMLSARF